jgi:hypothetical protein
MKISKVNRKDNKLQAHQYDRITQEYTGIASSYAVIVSTGD